MIAGTALLLFVNGRAVGQTKDETPATAPLPPVRDESASPSADAPLPPYESKLERMSELMGTLAYLRGICGQDDSDEWRQRMSALLDAEASTPARRARLAGAFNHGFRGYEATYRACTASAETVIRRSLAEGDRLSRELSTRYGGG